MGNSHADRHGRARGHPGNTGHTRRHATSRSWATGISSRVSGAGGEAAEEAMLKLEHTHHRKMHMYIHIDIIEY